MEIPDVIVVNKADHPMTDTMVREIRGVLSLGPSTSWRVPIIRTEAAKGEGVAELAEKIAEHRAHIEAEGTLEERRARNLRNEVLELAAARLRRRLEADRRRRPRRRRAARPGRPPRARPRQRRHRAAGAPAMAETKKKTAAKKKPAAKKAGGEAEAEAPEAEGRRALGRPADRRDRQPHARPGRRPARGRRGRRAALGRDPARAARRLHRDPLRARRRGRRPALGRLRARLGARGAALPPERGAHRRQRARALRPLGHPREAGPLGRGAEDRRRRDHRRPGAD